MKKALSILIAGALCLTLCACDVESNNHADETTSFDIEYWENYNKPTVPDLYTQIQSKCELWITWYDEDISIEITNIEKDGNYYSAYGIVKVYDDWGYLDEIDRFHIKRITVNEHGWVQIDWQYMEYDN